MQKNRASKVASALSYSYAKNIGHLNNQGFEVKELEVDSEWKNSS
jgi:hypothetical protein